MGDTIVMDDKHYLLYRNLIEWEQQDKLIASNGHFYLNGREVEHYVFMHNYYFMGGDNCYNSQDSRYWGPLPEEYIVGKATLIWKSKNGVTDEIRMDRIFKKIK